MREDDPTLARLRTAFADAVQEQTNNARGNVRKATLDRLLDTLARHLDAIPRQREVEAERAVASGEVAGVLRFAPRATPTRPEEGAERC